MIGTEAELQQLGYSADDCLSFDLPATFDALASELKTVAADFQALCPQQAASAQTDAQLRDRYLGRTPPCSGEPTPDRGGYDLPPGAEDDTMQDGQ